MELYLCILSEYMANCPTRVMASQVLEVCLETLLRLKVLNCTREKCKKSDLDVMSVHHFS